MARTVVTFRCDVEPASAVIAEVAEMAPKILQRLRGLGERAGEHFLVELNNRAAAGAGEVVVGLDPSAGLLRLAAALRAWDAELGVIEQMLRHPANPRRGVKTPPA